MKEIKPAVKDALEIEVPEVIVPAPFEAWMKHMTGIREDAGRASPEVLSEGSRLYVYDEFKFVCHK